MMPLQVCASRKQNVFADINKQGIPVEPHPNPMPSSLHLMPLRSGRACNPCNDTLQPSCNPGATDGDACSVRAAACAAASATASLDNFDGGAAAGSESA
jgi:hypothetical protein